MRKLEITLGSLRQSQLWLSNSLRLLAESVNTDHNERDLLVYEVREKVQSMGWRLSALEEKITGLQADIAAQTQQGIMRDRQITDRLDALDLRLLALEGVQQGHGTTREPAAAELRQDICNQLICIATLLNNREYEEPASPLEARIRAAREVAKVLRSPARSVGTSRAPSPAPSVRF